MVQSTELQDPTTESLRRALERERAARRKAEQLMIDTCRELYQSNEEIKRTAVALEKEVHRSRAVFNSAAEGIIIFDDDGTIDTLNPAAINIFKAENTEALNVCQLLPEATFCRNEGQSFATELRNLLGESNETVGKTSEGTEIPLEFVISEFSANGITAYSGIVRDLSRRKQLEGKLAQAQKLESVGQLASGIAHELNTPIQFVDNNTRFLKDAFASIRQIFNQYEQLLQDAENDPELNQLADEIRQTYRQIDLAFLIEEIPLAIDQTLEGTQSVSRIVKAMKGFAHPGSDNFQEVDLNQALESTLIVSKSEWKYCAELVTQFAPNLPRVRCLPSELNQVFLNLIINAVHAMEDKKSGSAEVKGTLTVATDFNDTHVAIEISDTGTGIPTKIQDRIFDPFFTTKGVGKGTGQGLAISYGIVVGMHKGSISFRSVENMGTTFRVELPRHIQ